MIKKIIYNSILLCAVFIAMQVSARSEYAISVPDTAVPRDGKTHLLPVSGRIDGSGTSMRIKLRFNSLCIDVKKAVGGEGYLIKDEAPAFSQNLSTLTDAWCEVSSANFATGGGLLFALEVEALAGPDSLTIVSPDSLIIDGTPATASFRQGLINVGTPNAIQEYPEGIYLNYPNPFSFKTKFSFNISNPGKVSFKFYSAGGRLVFSIPEDHNATVDYYVSDYSGTIINNPADFNFPKGSYGMELYPKHWDFASGPYYVIMETSKGKYYGNFVFQK